MFYFEIEKNKKNMLVIFFGAYNNNETYFTSQVEEIYSKHHRPDRVIFVSDLMSAKALNDKYSSDMAFKSNIERYGSKSEIIIFGLNEEGDVSYTFGCAIKFAKENIQIILDSGLKTLCEINNVIEHAPPGTAFLKPSNKIEYFFISGHRIAQNSSQIIFIAFCIIRKLKNINSITNIFYDTSSISYVALSIISIINKCKNDISFNPRHESFHSYGGYKEIEIDDPSKCLFLISASTSDNLSKLINEHHNIDPKNIISIISTESNQQNLINVTVKKNESINNYPPKLIRKVDEYFTSEVSAPNLVSIKAIHGKEFQKSWPFEILHNKDVVRCHISNSDRTKIREFAIKFPEFNSQCSFSIEIDKWWTEIIEWHVRANTKWLITDSSDPACQRFNKKVQELTHLNLEIIDIKDLSSYDFNNSSDSLIVYLPSIASGNVFVSANRDMRLGKHNGMRLFVCNFHLFRGMDDLRKFESSLSFGPSLNKYSFFCQYKINIPYRELLSTWEREDKLLSLIDSSNEFFTTRKAILSNTSEGLRGHIGIHASGCDKILQFTRHFAFWPKFTYNECDVTPESVYFTIASVLQEARDNKEFTGQNSLSFSISQQSLLAPDNFVRFNDPLIQSCLWRAAKDSEVDYSNNNEVGAQFSEILLRLLKHRDNEKGSASLDLLFGIAMGKIKIPKESINKILVEIGQVDCERFKSVFEYIKELYCK